MKIEKFGIKGPSCFNHQGTCQIYWEGLNDYGAKINWDFGEEISIDELVNLKNAIEVYLTKLTKNAKTKKKDGVGG